MIHRHLRACFSVLVACAAPFALASCGGGQGACSSGASCETMTVVVSSLSFVKHNADGTIEGFDVDHADSSGIPPDYTGCGMPDQLSSTGQRGIDNNLALTFESIDNLTNGAVDGLVKAAINAGTLLVIFRVEGVDDRVNDPHVVVRLMKGSTETPPIIATTGFLAPSQTFGVDEATPISTGYGRIENGVLLAGPFEATIPLKIFGVSANIRVHDALMRGTVNSTGGLGDLSWDHVDGGVDTIHDTLMGGGIEVDQILDIAHQAGAMDHNAATIAESADVFLHAGADLGFDGESCVQISAALRFRTEPAFLLGDTP